MVLKIWQIFLGFHCYGIVSISGHASPEPYDLRL